MSSSTQDAHTVDPKKILVIDDDDAVRNGLGALLARRGYHILCASSGREAVEVLQEQSCDLALLDMNMPSQNGWGTIAALRALNPCLPVIFITARPDQATVAREAGVDLMEKPLDLDLLLQRIQDLVASSCGAMAQRF